MSKRQDPIIRDTGERMIPEKHKGDLIYAEHVIRYIAAEPFVRDKVVLDIACGTGYGTKLLAQKAKKVIGVDIDKQSIDYAKKNYNADNIEYLTGDAVKIPLEDNLVDVVISLETIEHVKDYRKFLKEIKRVLKPQGLVVISTPNDIEFAEGNRFHYHEFTYQELIHLLKCTFKHVKPYFQATWKSVGIGSKEDMHKEGEIKFSVVNYAPLNDGKYLYFYVLCSDRSIKEKIHPILALGGHYSDREIIGAQMTHEKNLMDYAKVVAELKAENIKLNTRLQAILNSRSYKTAIKLARIRNWLVLMDGRKNRSFKRLVGKLKLMIKKGKPKLIAENIFVNKLYRQNDQLLNSVKRAGKTKAAAIVHLYYTESWELFRKAIKNYTEPIDLYVTLPRQNLPFSQTIKADFPAAMILEVPNRGRDVLPFLRLAEKIDQLGYVYLIKLHSKKSTHRQDGREWLTDMVNKLLPANKTVIENLVKTLERSDTGIVGPQNHYISLRVNFEANGVHMTKVASAIYSKEVAYKVLQAERSQHGFFEGTMFWTRLDAIRPILRQRFSVANFETEQGQIDGTFAHVMERMFCIVPQIEGRKLYEMSAAGIQKLSYRTDNIPEWSDLYEGPKT